MSHTKEQYHIQRQVLIDSLGGECEICHSKTNLQFHTIDGTGEHGCGGWKKLYLVKINMEKDNIQLVCKKCHTEIHSIFGFAKNTYQVKFVGAQNGNNNQY
jgi:hypothetical protein